MMLLIFQLIKPNKKKFKKIKFGKNVLLGKNVKIGKILLLDIIQL